MDCSSFVYINLTGSLGSPGYTRNTPHSRVFQELFWNVKRKCRHHEKNIFQSTYGIPSKAFQAYSVITERIILKW